MLLAACFVAPSQPVAAQEQDSTLQAALDAYSSAQSSTDRNARLAGFARAEQLFTQAASVVPANAELFTNTGTAALRAERIGPAVLAFRKALLVDPDHERAQKNLLHTRQLLPAWVPRPRQDSVLDSFFFWHRSLSSAERLGAGAWCFAFAALLLAVSLLWQNRFCRWLSVITTFVWMGMTVSVAWESLRPGNQLGVVIAEETPARASDSTNAPLRYAQALPGGTEVEIVEHRGRWMHIQFANGHDAWVAASSIGLVS